MRNFGLAYAAGTLGGVANSLFGLLLLKLGFLYSVLGVQLPPSPFPATLYQRMVWGGIWGALLIFPLRAKLLVKGFLLSIPPTLVAGFLVFPNKMGAGYFGTHISPWMPLVILLFNWVWGVASVAAARAMGLPKA